MLIEIDSLDHLEKVLGENDTTIVMLTQPSWCVPCRRLRPHVERLAKEDGEVVAYVDLDAVPEAIDRFEVQGVPKLYHYCGNHRLGELKGQTIIQLRKELSDA